MSAQPIPPDWQEHLDFLLPRREYLRPGEVAKALNIDLKTIDNLFAHDGRRAGGSILKGFDFVARGSGQRPHKRIARFSVLLLLIERSNYTPAEARTRLREVLASLSVRDLVALQGDLADLIRKKS